MQAVVLTDLGESLHAASRPEEARQAWQQALAILDDLGDPTVDEVRARLHDRVGKAEA